MIVWIPSQGLGKMTTKKVIGSSKCYLGHHKFTDNKKDFSSLYPHIFKQLNLNK